MDPASNLTGKNEYVNACPYLGLEEDPETYLAWAANGNFCHRVHPPQPVTHEHQTAACLARPVDCPVYQASSWEGPLPDVLRRDRAAYRNRPALPNWRSLVVWIVIVLLITGLIGSFWVFDPFTSLLHNPSTETPTAQPTYTPSYTPSPTITLTPSPTLTATFIPSPTPILIPSASPLGGIESVLAYGSNLRIAPVGSAAVLRFLDIDTPVVITGRSEDELWGYVRLADGTVGWIAMTQFEEGLDISDLPLGPAIIPTLNATP